MAAAGDVGVLLKRESLESTSSRTTPRGTVTPWTSTRHGRRARTGIICSILRLRGDSTVARRLHGHRRRSGRQRRRPYPLSLANDGVDFKAGKSISGKADFSSAPGLTSQRRPALETELRLMRRVVEAGCHFMTQNVWTRRSRALRDGASKKKPTMIGVLPCITPANSSSCTTKSPAWSSRRQPDRMRKAGDEAGSRQKARPWPATSSPSAAR